MNTLETRPSLANPALLTVITLVLLLCSGLFAWHYADSERMFRIWDDRHYHALAVQSSRLALHEPQSWPPFFKFWQTQDYNAVFTVPLIPVIEHFGTSRPVFVSALAVLYLVPCMVIYILMSTLFTPDSPRARTVALVSTAVATLLSTGPWRPTLIGLPDAGGAALFGLALWTYLYNIGRHRAGTALFIGVLIAAAILFRRHFAYAAFAFYVTIIAHDWMNRLLARRTHPVTLKGLLQPVGFVLLAGSIQVALMLTLATEFTLRSILTDYSTVYDSYRRSIGDNLLDMLGSFGAISLTLGILGMAGSALKGMPVPSLRARFILLYTLFWLAVWLIIARQITSHTTLHALLPLTTIGTGLVIAALWQRGRFATALLSTLLLGAQFAFSFSPWPIPPSPIAALQGTVLPRPLPPPVDHAADYNRYIAYVNELRQIIPPDEPIYVASSSYRFSDHHLLSVEETVWGHHRRHFTLLPTAIVDSRDFLPVTMMTRAQWVIVATPTQTILPDEQHVVRMAAESMLDASLWGDAFELIGMSEPFSDDMVLRLYRRIRDSTAHEVAAIIDNMQEAMGRPSAPAIQPQWIVTAHLRDLHIDAYGDLPATLQATLPAGGKASFVSHRAYHGTIALSGFIEHSGCAAPPERDLTDTVGNTAPEPENRKTTTGAFQYSFTAGGHLVLNFHNQADTACGLRITQLSIQSQ
jgi:hypothetical protein